MADFAGKVVLITGAAGGFGAALAQHLFALGARLALSDLDAPDLDLGAETFCTALDVTDADAHNAHVRAILDRWGRLDIAVNNAGIAPPMAPLHKTSEKTFDQVMAVNAKGVFLGMAAQIPPMIDAQQGVILNTSSAAGLVGAGRMAAYAASKHAVIGMTRSAADEVARHGIRVNAICPSFAPTSLLTPLTDQVSEDRMTARIPMRRLARVEEVVQAMVWAISPNNTFMTGQAISVDGGLTAV